MSDAAFPAPTPATGTPTPATGTPSASAAPADQRARHAGTDAAVTTRRWAVGTLAVASTVLALYVAALVVGVWLIAAAWGVMTSTQAVLDIGGLARDVAPALLVGWCTGLAASAVLARGEALGPRLAGVAAGALGTASGAAVLALTGSLLRRW
jgi:hypothetical protein